MVDKGSNLGHSRNSTFAFDIYFEIGNTSLAMWAPAAGLLYAPVAVVVVAVLAAPKPGLAKLAPAAGLGKAADDADDVAVAVVLAAM